MSSVNRILGAVLSNWMALFNGFVIAFFLSPFVVHHLGDTAYGIWVLIGSCIGYVTLLDLGLRGAVTHFVARSHAIGNHSESSHAISAALCIRVVMSGVVVIVTTTAALFINKMFSIPAEFHNCAQWVVAIVGIGMAVSFVTGVFGAILVALHRFDILSGLSIGQGLATAAGMIALLKLGHGILALAILQACLTVLFSAVTVFITRRLYPELRISFHRPQKPIISTLWNYSVFLFLINISGQFVYYADNVVVGTFLSMQAVTLFAIGGRLVEYQRQVATSLAQTFMPLASAYGGKGEHAELRRLLIQGTRAAVFVSWPIQIVLFVRGETFIRLWMGPRYASVSAHVLRILLISTFVGVANYVSGNITFGLGKHRPFAYWQTAEAIANLALSIVLVKRVGIYGVAWGTAIPSLITQTLVWPNYICRILGVRWLEYMWKAWLRPLLALAPFALACVYSDHFWAAKRMSQFFIQVVALCPLLAVGILWCMRREIEGQMSTSGTSLNKSMAWFGLLGKRLAGISASAE